MSRFIKIPGMVDPHVHLRDLDWGEKGTFASETAAAIVGGYWAVLDMPNTPPTATDQAALDSKLAALQAGALCDWGVYFGASQDDNTAEYAAVAAKVCGLKIYNNATTGDLLIPDNASRDRHYAAWPEQKIIAVHAEEDTVLDILALVRKHRKRTHFLHISTRTEIGYLTDAKEERLPVTIGVCPHHLFLTEADLSSLGGLGWMKPGLKTSADRDALWEALRSGVVDVVESDHAPHSSEEKRTENPPYGVPGLETTLPLLLTAVREGRLTLERVIELVSTNPRRIWGLLCPPDTYAAVDLDAIYEIRNESLLTACGWSPFAGMRVSGKVRQTWLRGQQAYDGERVLVTPGFGNNLYENRG